MKKHSIKLLENEHWWGGCADDGIVMPFDKHTRFSRCLDPNPTFNQAVPLLLSDQGRYIWCESGFSFTVEDGILQVQSQKADPQLYEGYETLAGAFRAASAAHFPPSGTFPASQLFQAPQYNTWIELMYDQSQEKVLSYAEQLLENGYPTGVLMIDCGWSPYYGKWDFNRETFPDPQRMVEKLHQMGFSVMLWVCPFVSPDSVIYRMLRDRGLLVKDHTENPAIKQWWDGFSAVLDLSNPEAVNWFHKQLQQLRDLYGIDGFKFDAGDAFYFDDDDVTFAPTDANGQSEAWGMLGTAYSFNEFRACFKCGGQGLAQRLRDKVHQWDDNGVSSLVPCALAQGMIGHPYVCPDMIGGGEYLNFLANASNLDPELFVRYAQCAALMPMTQYSAAPWRVLDSEHNRLCREAALLHTQYADEIMTLAEHAAKTGEPIVRYLEYVFPHQGLAAVIDQFMLGDTLMVAPVLEKGAVTRTVVFPKGRWQSEDGTIYQGGTQTVPAPLDTLPLFRRID